MPQFEEVREDLMQRIGGEVDSTLTTLFQEFSDRESALLEEIDQLKRPVPPAAIVKTLFGAGGGNKDRRGTGIKVDRRYYGSSEAEITKAIRDIKANGLVGIVTWVSFKLPVSWEAAARGEANFWFDNVMKRINEAVAVDDKVDVVFLSVHHEPEGDGDEDLWRQFQDILSRRVPGGIEGPIKYILTTTGWGQEYNPNRVADEVDWETNLYPWGAPIYAIAYDAPYNVHGYVWEKGVKTSKMDNGWTDPHVYVDKLADRAESISKKEGRKVYAMIGEWGYSDEAFAKDKTWAEKVMQRAKDRGLVAVAYFDTPLNSKRSWLLGAADSAKRKYFDSLIAKFNG